MEEYHAHVEQLPLSGPLELPDEQVPVAPHQPQGYSPVQLPQSVLSPQVSALDEHAEITQLQSEQLPPVGPLDVPARQPPAPSPHQPQPAIPVHVSQFDAVHAGGVPPAHALGNQSQSLHDPSSGPPEEPAAHPPPSPHHPHGYTPVHELQVE
jgi:hypothetical protein